MPPVVKNRRWLRAVESGGIPAESARTLSDPELIEGIVQGNTQVSGAFHDRLIDVIDHTLFRVLGRRDSDHEDLIQVCFEQVLRTLISRSFAGDCSLRTWAGRITTHVALNTLRSRMRERKVFHKGEDHEYDAPSPGDSTLRTHAVIDLDRARRVLSKMRSSKSEVLILHDVHGYNLNEIASMLDLSVAATQSRLVRGRTEFRTKLAALDGRHETGPSSKPRLVQASANAVNTNDPAATNEDFVSRINATSTQADEEPL